ncbi:MAG: hypothetical protein EZS28_009424 [Streblomastix strix]|uniref:Wiskott-Aldrich syndrome protein family member n=1 Tax=Streblomastix strix TaxID=222440 RepID=A0A5J4WJL0_9EUKA|nr:MAG: hypothetical protein EZS28_009424 [Streblomastix strix]
MKNGAVFIRTGPQRAGLKLLENVLSQNTTPGREQSARITEGVEAVSVEALLLQVQDLMHVFGGVCESVNNEVSTLRTSISNIAQRLNNVKRSVQNLDQQFANVDIQRARFEETTSADIWANLDSELFDESTRLPELRTLYEAADPMPNIKPIDDILASLPDSEKPDKCPILRNKYSYPGFFEEQWIKSIQQADESQKNRKAKKKRSGERGTKAPEPPPPAPPSQLSQMSSAQNIQYGDMPDTNFLPPPPNFIDNLPPPPGFDFPPPQMPSNDYIPAPPMFGNLPPPPPNFDNFGGPNIPAPPPLSQPQKQSYQQNQYGGQQDSIPPPPPMLDQLKNDTSVTESPRGDMLAMIRTGNVKLAPIAMRKRAERAAPLKQSTFEDIMKKQIDIIRAQVIGDDEDDDSSSDKEDW